jgi:hypothetical protein
MRFPDSCVANVRGAVHLLIRHLGHKGSVLRPRCIGPGEGPYPNYYSDTSFVSVLVSRLGRVSSVGIATRYRLEGPGIAPVQTGPGAHPASDTMSTGSFQGVKRPGRGVDHSPPSSALVKERVGLYLYSLFGPSWPVLGWTLPLPLLVSRVPDECSSI